MLNQATYDDTHESRRLSLQSSIITETNADLLISLTKLADVCNLLQIDYMKVSLEEPDRRKKRNLGGY